jgi:hypothetical protein
MLAAGLGLRDPDRSSTACCFLRTRLILRAAGFTASKKYTSQYYYIIRPRGAEYFGTHNVKTTIFNRSKIHIAW